MSEANAESVSPGEVLRMTSQVVAAYVSNNVLAVAQLPELISATFGTLNGLNAKSSEAKPEPQKPAVAVKKSVTPEYIVCLEDGKKLKMLKRHIRTNYGLSPDEYRAKWGLAPDYPMVAPNYAAQRSAFAKKIGLGRTTGGSRRRRGRK
jgi:predicted transcriptional regulator